MHLILTGATGLVGSSVLDAMLKAKEVSKISILSRRPIKMAEDAHNPKVNVIIHNDFGRYEPAVLDQLKDAQGCVWALGISQTKVSKEDYVKITKDYTLVAAESFASLPSSSTERPFRFVYVSGEGATQTPGRFSAIFARVKGETEQELAHLSDKYPTLQADSVRPAFVDAAAHADILPYIPDPGLLYKAGLLVIAPPIRIGLPGSHSPTQMLGSFLTQMAAGSSSIDLQASGATRLGTSWVVPNVAMRRAMGM